jgi:myo-inositol-1(or 4)-monophosphatase
VSEFLDIAIAAAKEAGTLLSERFGKHLTIEKKGQVNLVTNADRDSEKLIKNIILARYPEHSFKAEEGTEFAKRSRYLWLVDPLDGTTNYAHGFPAYCVSIALLEDDEVIAACIYNPNLDECFTAEKGRGAFLNGLPIAPSVTEKLDDSLLATGFPYDIRESSETNLKEFGAFAIVARAIRRAGSAALDLAYTACGRFDGFWEFKLSPWDIAAGILIVREAGGKVTNWSGQKYDIFKGEVLASNGKIHDEMLGVLKKVRS